MIKKIQEVLGDFNSMLTYRNREFLGTSLQAVITNFLLILLVTSVESITIKAALILIGLCIFASAMALRDSYLKHKKAELEAQKVDKP